MKPERNNHAGKAGGFSLIEVLVALLVLAVGVLGAAALQMNALKYNQTAAVRSHATLLAYDILDRMRANREAALAGDYDHGINDAFPNDDAAAVMSLRDLAQWGAQLAEQLPGGDGEVARDDIVFTVTVQWDESRIGGDDTQQFVFSTEL